MSAKQMNPKTAVNREVQPFGQGAMMQVDPRAVPLADVVVSYAAINHLEKVIGKRKEVLKPHLISQAETHGTPTEKGHRVLEVGQEKVIRERKLSSEPDEDKLKALLETKGISILEAFDEVKAVVLNASKLQYLVQIGKLKAEEVEALRDESFALKVEAGPELKELLIAACGAAPEKEEEKPSGKKRARR
jgi:hypothetical protein